MVEELISQLRSTDPDVRRKAVIALANSRDSAALAPLAAVYRTDPDPQVRELALKAGRYIKQQTATFPAASQPVAAAVPEPSSVTEEAWPPVAPVPAEPKQVSARDAELAKNYLDTATTHHLNGDRARAVDHVGKALALNPNLQKDSFVINLILSLMAMPMADALPILTHPDRRAEYIYTTFGGKAKLKKTQSHGAGAEKATWENVLVDFGLYWLVTTLSLIFVLVVLLDRLKEAMNDVTMPPGTSADLDTLLAASVMGLVFAAVFVGITSALSLAVQGVAIHVAASYIFAGDGTLAYLYRRLVPFQTVLTLIFTGAFLLLMLGGSAEVMFLIGLGGVGGAVAVAWYMSSLVAEVYGFGTASGCGSIFLGSILLGFASQFANYFLLQVLSSLFGG